MTDQNKQHWDSLGAQYGENWASPTQQVLSRKETSFIIKHLLPTPGQAVLDVGIGTGRILRELVAQSQVDRVYGVDIASEMVALCEARLGSNPKVKALVVCDIAREPLPVPTGMNFVSAIRMLKYSPNWWDILETKLLPHMATGGVLVFSMPNANSVKRFSRPYAVEYFKTTETELRRRLRGSGLHVLEVSGFTKVPDVFYRTFKRPLLAKSLLALEQGLDQAIGPARLTRELFVAARLS